jgi:predicted GNAT superfamily acetyltransferase
MQVCDIEALDDTEQRELLALNNANARELSYLDWDKWRDMVGNAFAARAVEKTQALMIVFDQAACYDSPNFLWFQNRLPRFVYVDRIVVADALRGRGVARRLYEELFIKARVAGHESVVCEVNKIPPNPASDAFHSRLGFAEMGQAQIHGGDKTVRYLQKRLEM